MAAGFNGRRLELKDLPILRRLGQGHSGYLYETEWGGEKCARKDFPLGSVEHNKLFETEVQPLFDLDHPNIVKNLGYTLGKSRCSLVQEYVDSNLQNIIQSRIEEWRKRSSGSTSTSSRVLDVDEIRHLVLSRGKKKEIATTDEGSSRCPRPTPFEESEAIAIIAQIARGMKHLHENEVVHGDLKPRNVLMYSESGERKVKLADFGLSETKKRITLVSERSRHLETVTWKAPECLRELLDDEEVNEVGDSESETESDKKVEIANSFLSSKLAMADVYSFGLTSSYILCGKVLDLGESLTKLKKRRMRGSGPKLPSACPEHLKAILDSCLKLVPSSRPTFSTICADLQLKTETAADSDLRRLDLKDLPSLRRLGQGHSGYLYETEWGGKKYARKYFPLGSVELNRLFETEVQPQFDLDHPNIVKCVGYTLGKSSCSLVQEYVEENLQNTMQSRIEEQRKTSSRSTSTSPRVLDVDEIRHLVSSRGKKKETATTDEGSSRCPRPTPFKEPEAIAIIAQVASGMKHLHENNVVHGDLKPRNVLLYSESGERKVKLADFGLSETKKRITLVSERSRHLETVTWKAPECLDEEEVSGPSIDDRDRSATRSAKEVGKFLRSKLAMADVYSFGLTCSYIIGGKLMYPDMSMTKLQERRMRGCRPKLPPACPEHLKSMIDSCLEFDPLSRPTFTTICADLQLDVALRRFFWTEATEAGRRIDRSLRDLGLVYELSPSAEAGPSAPDWLCHDEFKGLPHSRKLMENETVRTLRPTKEFPAVRRSCSEQELEVDNHFSNMAQQPFDLSEEAFQEPTNELIRPRDIDPLREEVGLYPRDGVPASVPANPPNPQQHQEETDLIMAQADDLQMFRDFVLYTYNGYDSDTDAPEDYSDADEAVTKSVMKGEYSSR